ncbi:MAG TPA: short-chain dehydrogenase [Oceanospirillaceae bacterium]|nr:short-chain dehydrogenase [Oceanospirillaceae bacterium]
MRFQDQRVVVTGAAGGIGQSLVKLFANEGAKVLAVDFSDKVADLAIEWQGQGLQVQAQVADLRVKADCEVAIQACVDTYGSVDILLNNAGIIPRGNILETTDDMWFDSMGVNLNAAFYLCRAAIPYMQAAGGGAIVNTSSVWGNEPGPGHIAYCTAKGALACFTRNLAVDHAPDNIRVNAVCPNEVNTPMIRSGFERRGLDPDAAVAQLNKSVPIGRIAEPEDIADVIAFLASDAARYMCGAIVPVTGAKPVYG